MAKAPDLKRITVEDFPSEDRDLVSKLAFIINSFHEQVRNALSKNIDFDNLAQETKVLTFTTNNASQPLNEVTFKSALSRNIQGISVIRAVITSDNTSYPTQLPIISWSQNASLVKITYIGGLEPETKYELTILTI